MHRGSTLFRHMRTAMVIAFAAAAARPGAAQAAGTTSDVPGALPGIHIIAPLANGQWTMPAGDYGNTRYSPLNKINTGNVGGLHVTGTYSTGISHGHEGQPMVVGSTLYVVTPFPNKLIALDLTQPGMSQRWIFNPHPDQASQGVVFSF